VRYVSAQEVVVMSLNFQVTFDAQDPTRLAEFWALALDYRMQPPPEGYTTWYAFAEAIGIPKDRWGSLAAVVDPDGGQRVLFQKVPEGKTSKNRVHLDINVSHRGLTPDESDGRDAISEHVDRLRRAGATFVREVDEPGGYCIVLQDPEGNEFCVQ
jgi:hypothetical protein